MSLSNSDKNTLEEIVVLNGQCLDSRRCQRCPFRAMCLPEFLNPVPPSPPKRLKIAQDVLTHYYLIDSDMEIDQEHKWDDQK